MTLEVCLQCFAFLPALLRFLHLRWRMPRQPFLLSALMLFFHSFDVSVFVRLALTMTTDGQHMATEAFACLSALFVGAASLSIATPPCFLGSEFSNAYLRWLHVCSAVAIDLPGFAIKLHVLMMPLPELLVPNVDALFFICLLKNCISLLVLLLVAARRLKGRKALYAVLGGRRSRSSSVSSADTQRLCPQTDHEDFV
jgi:hypothetical protein